MADDRMLGREGKKVEKAGKMWQSNEKKKNMIRIRDGEWERRLKGK